MLNRRKFLNSMIGTGGLSGFWFSCSRKQSPVKPNILLILANDLGYGDLGCYGNREVQTPVIVQLAAQGVRFTAFYSNRPECTPTRTALLTGRYQQRVGGLECAIGIGNVGRYDDAIRLREQHALGLPASEVSLAQMLKQVGYCTAVCGNWHLGYEKQFSPNRHGFDYAFYAIGGAMDYYYHVEPPPSCLPALYLNERPIKKNGYFADLITEEALKFLDRQSHTQPFFLYLTYTAPHSPYQDSVKLPSVPLPDNSQL